MLQTDVESMTDAELVEAVNLFRAEQVRREDLQRALAQSPVLAEAFQRDVLDREPGQEWKQPLGAFDAYPLGWEVRYEDRDWVSLVDANVWRPGESGWREIGIEGAPVEWVQPSGAHDAYQMGDQVTHDGHLWESTAENNVWRPGEYGWDDLGATE